MAKKFATNVDLLLNELQNAKIHIVASDPSSPQEGQIYYNSTTKVLKFYNASAWVSVGNLNQMTATGAISVNNQLISSVANPISDTDAATKGYVDSVAQGLDVKPSVVVATTANITLSAPQTIDGIAIVAGDRVLVKNQTLPADNGIYIAAASTWARSAGTNAWSEIIGAFCFVEKGTTQADTGWLCTVDAGGTLGTTAITFAQFSAAGQVTGANLTGTGAVNVSVFAQKSGNDLQFRQLSTPAGQNAIVLTQNTNDISISPSAKLEALQDQATSGIIAQTGAATFAARTITAPAAGMTISNGDGVAGNPTIVLANDLAAVENLSTTGIIVRTADGAMTTRTLAGGNDITVTAGDGVASAPSIAVNPTTLHDTRKFAKYVKLAFTFATAGTDIALTHNLALTDFESTQIEVYETTSKAAVEIDRSSTASTANITYIKMYGATTTASFYTAVIMG